jgi:predicted RNase H-like nuclease (RuvC/YqgF family)
MNTLDILKNRFFKLTKDFNFLAQENKQLRAVIEQLTDKNDILNSKSEDLILTINSKLKKRGF